MTNICENRRARYDYFIEDTLEAGLVLLGTEVKSLRENGGNIAESYVSIENGEAWLINSTIPIWESASQFNHAPTRHRKLLLSKKEISKLMIGIQREGMTIIPLRMYRNESRRLKIEIGLAKGKKTHDKREATAARDWAREKARLIR